MLREGFRWRHISTTKGSLHFCKGLKKEGQDSGPGRAEAELQGPYQPDFCSEVPPRYDVQVVSAPHHEASHRKPLELYKL